MRPLTARKSLGARCTAPSDTGPRHQRPGTSRIQMTFPLDSLFGLMTEEGRMSETVASKRFHEFDWRVIRDDAATHFRTGSFAEGLALVEAIGKLSDATNHPPDIDLRSDGVTVRVGTHSGGRSERDLELARQISEVARDLGATVDLTGLQHIQVAIDALVIPEVLPFWRAVLGYERVADEDLVDPDLQGPPFWFQQMDAPRPFWRNSAAISFVSVRPARFTISFGSLRKSYRCRSV